jgi:hypothetical protein
MYEGFDPPEEQTPRNGFGVALSAVAGVGNALANLTARATSQYSRRGAFHPLVTVLAPQVSDETQLLLRQQASGRAANS